MARSPIELSWTAKKRNHEILCEKRNNEQVFLRSGPALHFCSFFLEHKIMLLVEIMNRKGTRIKGKYFNDLKYPYIVYIQSMTLFFVIDRSQWHFLAGLAINFCHWLQSMTDVHKFGVIDWSQWHMAISSSNIGDSNCHWPVNDSFF